MPKKKSTIKNAELNAEDKKQGKANEHVLSIHKYLFTGKRKRTFETLAETMGVSRQALAIRLEQLGFTEKRDGWTLGPLPTLIPEAGELEE